MKKPCWTEVIGHLDKHPGIHTYGEVAAAIRSHPRAVGRMMVAIHNRERHQYCPRVVDAKTRQPSFTCR
jgi:hypothetical protein